MKFKKQIRGFMCILHIFIAGAIFAQEDKNPALSEEKAETKQEAAQISALAYINWHDYLTKSTNNGSGKQYNTFELERLYLTYEKKIDKIFSAKVTTDLSNEAVIENAELIQESVSEGTSNQEFNSVEGDITSKYRLYLKNGYVQAADKKSSFEWNIKFGLIPTPVIGFFDKLGGQRWVNKTMIDDSKSLLPDKSSIDSSADMGASFEISVLEKADLVIAVTNGEGFKKTNETLFYDNEDSAKNTAEGKAYYARMAITPIKSLYINGFYRLEGTSVNEEKNHKGFYGGGLAWKDKLIKTGISYIAPFNKKEGKDAVWNNGDKVELSLLDAWLTITPEKYIGIPALLMARYGQGKDLRQGNSMKTFLGFGLGYSFNENVRTIVWLKQTDSEAADAAELPNPERSVWLKAEVEI